MSTHRRTHRRSINEPGHAHELTFSCFHKYRFLQAERTCVWLRDAIDDARKQFDFSLWAFVFMPEHIHMIVCPRQAVYRIEDICKAIKAPVAENAIEWLKKNSPEWLRKITRRRSGRKERLFWQSGGGYDRNITEGKTLLRMIDYIHLNPVRRGLVKRAADWKWSSAAWYLEQREIPLVVDGIPPEWLLGL